MDWNWFFSAYSQSSAALLGIIGAFLISRLIGIDEKSNNLQSNFKDLTIDAEKIKERLHSRKYHWVNWITVKHNDDLHEQVERGEFNELSRNQVLQKIYENDDRLYNYDDPIMKAFDEIYEDFSKSSTQNLLLGKTVKELAAPKDLWWKVNEERDKIKEDVIISFETIRRFKKLYFESHSYDKSLITIKVIVIALAVSFPIIVIYPLHFIPLNENVHPDVSFHLKTIFLQFLTLKNLLLAALLVFFEGVFGYFLYFINGVRRELGRISNKNHNDYEKITFYCPFYREAAFKRIIK